MYLARLSQLEETNNKVLIIRSPLVLKMLIYRVSFLEVIFEKGTEITYDMLVECFC